MNVKDISLNNENFFIEHKKCLMKLTNILK